MKKNLYPEHEPFRTLFLPLSAGAEKKIVRFFSWPAGAAGQAAERQGRNALTDGKTVEDFFPKIKTVSHLPRQKIRTGIDSSRIIVYFCALKH